mmetsp:Transcript_57775/g.84517  ORF Transcript_57775/g.84517 Transcript_57775/m.84517 type:complete len:85 (+) Transcript_57775:502-756(+)
MYCWMMHLLKKFSLLTIINTKTASWVPACSIWAAKMQPDITSEWKANPNLSLGITHLQHRLAHRLKYFAISYHVTHKPRITTMI